MCFGPRSDSAATAGFGLLFPKKAARPGRPDVAGKTRKKVDTENASGKVIFNFCPGLEKGSFAQKSGQIPSSSLLGRDTAK